MCINKYDVPNLIDPFKTTGGLLGRVQALKIVSCIIKKVNAMFQLQLRKLQSKKIYITEGK